MFDELRDLYQTVILDHSRSPRHMLRLEVFDAAARGDNPMCGDRVEVRVKYAADGSIAEAGFEARGCAISIASADLMAAASIGRKPEEVRALFADLRELTRTGHYPAETISSGMAADAARESLRPLSGVHEFPSRVKCATLPWHALLAALEQGKEAERE